MSTEYDTPLIFPDDSPRARRTDPVTSHEAADATAHAVAASQRAVANIFENENRPLTARDVEQLRFVYGLPYSESRLRSAVAELGRLGVLEVEGFVRREGDKRRRQLWKLVAA